MQIGAKMVHRSTMDDLTHKHTMVQICKAFIILLPLIYFVTNEEGYIKMPNALKLSQGNTKNFQFCQVMSPITL
jgi:hypothetical protein